MKCIWIQGVCSKSVPIWHSRSLNASQLITLSNLSLMCCYMLAVMIYVTMTTTTPHMLPHFLSVILRCWTAKCLAAAVFTTLPSFKVYLHICRKEAMHIVHSQINVHTKGKVCLYTHFYLCRARRLYYEHVCCIELYSWPVGVQNNMKYYS